MATAAGRRRGSSRLRHPAAVSPVRPSSRGGRLPLAALIGLAAVGCAGDDGEPIGPPDSPPAEVVAVVDTRQEGLDGIPLRDSLTVRVLDQAGRVADGVDVRWSLTGAGSVDRTTVRTGPAGEAAVLLTPGVGEATLTASVDGVDAPVAFTISGRTAEPGDRWSGRSGWIDYRSGSLPVVISAPHGGTLRPSEIPDRTAGTTVRDADTDDLALRLAAALEARTGARPHLIVSYLHRVKVDLNRDLAEAAQGNPIGEHVWREFMGAVDHARDRVAENGPGLYLDLHGHGHDIQRVELGYLLTNRELRRSSHALGQRAAVSSIAALARRSEYSFDELIRRAPSFGAGLQALGYRTVPSPVELHPGGLSVPYFTGGYNTRRWGSRDGGEIDGIQIEANRTGVRDTPENRQAFAEALAVVIERWIATHYGWTPGG